MPHSGMRAAARSTTSPLYMMVRGMDDAQALVHGDGGTGPGTMDGKPQSVLHL
jgi:hypothetical protein